MLPHGKHAYRPVGLFQRCSLSLTLFMRCPFGTLFTPQCARGVWSGKPSPSLSQCSSQNLLCVKASLRLIQLHYVQLYSALTRKFLAAVVSMRGDGFFRHWQ